MATVLSINFNKIALVRNSRGRDYPSVNYFADIALAAGAGGLTIHPRPDQRHAKYSDIPALKEVTLDYAGAELNVEGYPCEQFMQQVLEHRPHQVTLVPDDPNQLTSDHGWDLSVHMSALQEIIKPLKDAGIRTSIFIDPDLAQIELAPQTGTDRIELYTEDYAQAYHRGEFESVLANYMACADRAKSLGLTVNAGHDLNLSNLGDFLTQGNIAEVSIGHALTVEALEHGFVNVVKQYLNICR